MGFFLFSVVYLRFVLLRRVVPRFRDFFSSSLRLSLFGCGDAPFRHCSLHRILPRSFLRSLSRSPSRPSGDVRDNKNALLRAKQHLGDKFLLLLLRPDASESAFCPAAALAAAVSELSTKKSVVGYLGPLPFAFAVVVVGGGGRGVGHKTRSRRSAPSAAVDIHSHERGAHDLFGIAVSGRKRSPALGSNRIVSIRTKKAPRNCFRRQPAEAKMLFVNHGSYSF